MSQETYATEYQLEQLYRRLDDLSRYIEDRTNDLANRIYDLEQECRRER